MSCSQVVRPGTLTPAFVGSSPTTTAIWRYGLYCSSLRKDACKKRLRSTPFSLVVLWEVKGIELLASMWVGKPLCGGSFHISKKHSERKLIDSFYMITDWSLEVKAQSIKCSCMMKHSRRCLWWPEFEFRRSCSQKLSWEPYYMLWSHSGRVH